MRILTLCFCMLFLLFGLATAVNAKEEKQHSGVETSAEHKSEQGLEHGKAYAGSKEKKAKEAEDEDEDDDNGKDKKDKEDKTKKSKGKKSK
jgi:hypothetical protein